MTVATRFVFILTWFISLCALGDAGLMKESTCDTIKQQLSLIDQAIADTNYLRELPSTTASWPYSRNAYDRLKNLLLNLNGKVAIEEGKRHQMHNFVQTKLVEFKIPVVGLEDDASQLNKVFNHTTERNHFYKQQEQEQIEKNAILEEQIKQFTSEIKLKEKKHGDLQKEIKELNDRIKQAEIVKKMLQAKINANPAAVQG